MSNKIKVSSQMKKGLCENVFRQKVLYESVMITYLLFSFFGQLF